MSYQKIANNARNGREDGSGEGGAGTPLQTVTVQPQEVQPVESPLVLVEVKPDIRDVYNAMCGLMCGVLHIVNGFLVILVNIGAIIIQTSLTGWLMPGLWCGPVFIITGIIGALAYKRITRCFVKTYLTFAIFCVIFAGCCIALGIMGLIEPKAADDDDAVAKMCMDILLAVLGLLELVVAIVTIYRCIYALCIKKGNMVGVHGQVRYTEKGVPKIVVVEPESDPDDY